MKRATTEISNNVFEGVHWDAEAIRTVQTVAEALLNLTRLFSTQNVTIEALLRVNQPVDEPKNKTKKKK